MFSLIASVAFAQTFTEDLGLVLSPSDSPLTANGIGAPTVAYDTGDDVYLMFFETRVAASTTACPAGQWGVGVASSQDGESWDVWPDLVVEPTPGTPFACVAAHPAVVFRNNVFHVWFKAEQGTDVVVDPGWGTDNYSGVGYATVDLSLDDKSEDIAAIDAEIADLEAGMQDAIADFDLLIGPYVSDLLAQEDEFVCLPEAPLCAPCGTATVAAVQVGAGTSSSTKDFCQPFDFIVPTTLNYSGSGLTSNDSGRLTWNLTGGGSENCIQSISAQGVPNYTCTAGVTPGVSEPSSNSVTLRVRVNSSPQTTAFASVTLTATNLGDMTFDGDLFDSLEDLQAATSAPSPDPAIVRPLLSTVIADLSALMNWLDNVPISPDEQVLLDQATALRQEAQDLRTLINQSNNQISDLEDDRDDLVNYQQFVTPTVTTNGVALQLNQVFGYPSVARMGNQWVMLLQRYPNLYRAVGSSPSSFTLDAAPVISAGTATWATTEVYEPAIHCDPGAGFEYVSWVAGRSTTPNGTLTLAGASTALSTNRVDWLLNTTADFTWSSIDSFRHFDVLADTSDELRMYYVERVGGLNEVHLQSSTTTWDDTQVLPRVCPSNN